MGSVAYDNVITPELRGDRILGGSAAYASLATSYYTACRLVGVVGNDFDPAFIDRFKARGICLEGLQQDTEGKTFSWTGEYSADGNTRETLDLQLNVFESFQPKLPEAYRQSPYVLLGNIRPDLQHAVCDQLQGKAFIVADTIDFWIETQKSDFIDLLKRIDCLVINDGEAALLTGEKNIIKAGKSLLEMGVPTAIIKKGEHGAYLFHAQGLFALPAYPVVEFKDPTGAGDSFAGALIGYLAATDQSDFATLKQAMLYATATASLTVEALSCDRLESGGSATIEQRVTELTNMINV